MIKGLSTKGSHEVSNKMLLHAGSGDIGAPGYNMASRAYPLITSTESRARA
jgi:hypothetical protein